MENTRRKKKDKPKNNFSFNSAKGSFQWNSKSGLNIILKSYRDIKKKRQFSLNNDDAEITNIETYYGNLNLSQISRNSSNNIQLHNNDCYALFATMLKYHYFVHGKLPQEEISLGIQYCAYDLGPSIKDIIKKDLPEIVDDKAIITKNHALTSIGMNMEENKEYFTFLESNKLIIATTTDLKSANFTLEDKFNHPAIKNYFNQGWEKKLIYNPEDSLELIKCLRVLSQDVPYEKILDETIKELKLVS